MSNIENSSQPVYLDTVLNLLYNKPCQKLQGHAKETWAVVAGYGKV